MKTSRGDVNLHVMDQSDLTVKAYESSLPSFRLQKDHSTKINENPSVLQYVIMISLIMLSATQTF
jgi:hypothetical protein